MTRLASNAFTCFLLLFSLATSEVNLAAFSPPDQSTKNQNDLSEQITAQVIRSLLVAKDSVDDSTSSQPVAVTELENTGSTIQLNIDENLTNVTIKQSADQRDGSTTNFVTIETVVNTEGHENNGNKNIKSTNEKNSHRKDTSSKVSTTKQISNEDDEVDVDCRDKIFCPSLFPEQPDLNRVYDNVEKLHEDHFFYKHGISKYITCYGTRIFAEEAVPDTKLIHVAKTFAQLLDPYLNGYLRNQKIVNTLVKKRSSIFIFNDVDKIIQFSEIPLDDLTGVEQPGHNQYGFSYETSEYIRPGLPLGDATCTNGTGDDFDRTAAMLLDHLIARGRNELFSAQDSLQISSLLPIAIERDIFFPQNTDCFGDINCLEVMLLSWAVSSYYNFDSCWCWEERETILCNRDMVKRYLYEVVPIIRKYFILDNI